MPFDPPCFVSEFFFNEFVVGLVERTLGKRIVIDQWGCDIPLPGADYQSVHVDYQRPLFSESPDLLLPPYMLVVSFGLVPISAENGAIEIAPGSHLVPQKKAMQAVETGDIKLESIPLNLGDVLIRHPWVMHRGTPNKTSQSRPLVSMRYVRHWYCDNSREVNSISQSVWTSLSSKQQNMMRFPISHC